MVAATASVATMAAVAFIAQNLSHEEKLCQRPKPQQHLTIFPFHPAKSLEKLAAAGRHILLSSSYELLQNSHSTNIDKVGPP